MTQDELVPADIRVLSEQIYQYKKGVRPMVLYTFPRQYELMAVKKLESQGIDYFIQYLSNDNINLFFGNKACMDTIHYIVNRLLNTLSPEEDFILGALLGYDITEQCQRYCRRKHMCGNNT